MPNKTYDAVIVGGRCAGGALGAFMARDGASVVVLDADKRGSDQVISTHTIHGCGMDILDELGVGDAVRQGSPPAKTLRLQIDDVYIDIVPQAGRTEEVCPRRHRLDKLVQDAAEAAGAEFCEQTRVTEVIREGDRVVGVRAENSGRTLEFRGRLTVGADGRHSTVAKLVEAEEYLAYDWPRGAYWAYWQPPAAWHTDEYPYDMALRFTGNERRLQFSTDEGELLLGTMPELDVVRRWRGDHEAGYLDNMRADAVFGPLVEQGKMMSKVVGTVRERFFFRRSAGPGWALLGDAGHHKDPLVGWGIAEALIQAKQLAAAAREGTEKALERYWRVRDIEALPRYRFAQDRGEAGSISRLVPVVMQRGRSEPGFGEQMFRETEAGVNPYELLPVGKIARWTLGAALRGRPGLIVDFMRQGRRASTVAREIKQRRKLLEAVEAA